MAEDGLSSLKYGHDTNGVGDYLDEIRTGALQNAKEAVQNIQDLEKACQADWKGKACENYLQNLRRDSNHCAEQFDALFNVLVSEVNSLNAAMTNKDANLIPVD